MDDKRNIKLLYPVGRQRWELLHADITVGQKLGAGAFGDVMAGTVNSPDGIKQVALKQVNVTYKHYMKPLIINFS